MEKIAKKIKRTCFAFALPLKSLSSLKRSMKTVIIPFSGKNFFFICIHFCLSPVNSSVTRQKSSSELSSCHNMPRTYSNVEYGNMVFVYSFCDKWSTFCCKIKTTFCLFSEFLQNEVESEHISTEFLFLVYRSLVHAPEVLAFKFQTPV